MSLIGIFPELIRLKESYISNKMITEPLVSIITPAYNHEKYIGDCIKSVQNQIYTNWEMIIINDGSTDKTLSVAQSFAEKDSRIRIFSQENVGIFRLADTYNFALKQAKGTYIAVLEGDDIWLSEKLAWQVPTLEQNDNAVLSWGKAFGVSIDLSQNYGLVPNLKFNENIFTNTPVKSSLKELLFSNYIPALTVLIRKSALNQIGGFIQNNNLPLVDLPTWQQLSLIGTFTYIDQPVGKWRVSPTQITKTYTIQMIEGVYKLALQLYVEDESFFKSLHITDSKIHHHFEGRLIVNYCHSGNFKLTRGDYSGSREDFYKSISSFGLQKISWKIRSAFGILKSIICSITNK